MVEIGYLFLTKDIFSGMISDLYFLKLQWTEQYVGLLLDGRMAAVLMERCLWSGLGNKDDVLMISGMLEEWIEGGL